MEIKRVKCPQCRTIYEVKNSKGEPEKIFACKECGTMLRVRFSAPGEQPMGIVDVDPQPSGSTVYGPTKGAKGVLLVGGKTYALSEGLNTVGRQSAKNTASLQLAIDDPYMSRRHAKIVCTNLGKPTFKAVLSNDQNKNDTLVDGVLLKAGEEVVLTDGCVIKMGDTEVVFHRE